MDKLLASKPENYSQLIKRSVTLYQLSFSKVILLAVLLAITIFIPRLLSDIIGQDLFLMLPPWSPHRLWLILINLVGLMFFIGIIWHMFCVVRNKHEPLIEDVEVGLKKLFYVVIATLIQTVVIFGISTIVSTIVFLLHSYQILDVNQPASFLIISLIFISQLVLTAYLSVLFVFLIPLIAIENAGILNAIQRSISLAWNHWWRIFSLQITPWICYVFALIFIRFILNINIHIYFFEQGTHLIWSTLLNIVLFALFIPWVAALLLVQLKDLELRKKTKK